MVKEQAPKAEADDLKANRITSYNVCYTKLLRIHASMNHMTIVSGIILWNYNFKNCACITTLYRYDSLSFTNCGNITPAVNHCDRFIRTCE